MTWAFGDIVWATLPTRAGTHEQQGTRPVLVVQDSTVTANLPTVVVIPFTSKFASARFETVFQVNPSPVNGLAELSFLLTFQIRAIDKSRIGARLGKLEPKHMEKLGAELFRLLPAMAPANALPPPTPVPTGPPQAAPGAANGATLPTPPVPS
jgi:mRNA-degrading endonuclease toxin of MazEF toxin-antitoxin module